ncbi:MAG: hypothetical protein R3A80_06500 [Bdellovibrionota bacterium]
MAPLAFEFFFRLLWGWNFYLIFISREESSEAFLKVSARFSFGFALTALLAGYSAGMSSMEQLPLFLTFLSSLAYLSRRFLPLRLFSVGIILFTPLLLLPSRGLLFSANMMLSSLALGGAFMGQFLGHWYLNVPNIHIREFKRISNFSFASLIARCLWVLAVVLFFKVASEGMISGEFFSLRGDYWNGLGAFGTLLFTSRVLWGLIAPLLLSWMAKKTVDMRSTQSATGIFYANSVLMLLGELCALYLEKELKWPI